jgi:hypothetical protein
MKWQILLIPVLLWQTGCTVKAIGDPNRPITINAHVTLDIKGLKDTASNIEDYVSGKESDVPVAKGKK